MVLCLSYSSKSWQFLLFTNPAEIRNLTLGQESGTQHTSTGSERSLGHGSTRISREKRLVSAAWQNTEKAARGIYTFLRDTPMDSRFVGVHRTFVTTCTRQIHISLTMAAHFCSRAMAVGLMSFVFSPICSFRNPVVPHVAISFKSIC